MVKKIRRECTVCGIMYKLKQGESFDNTCSVKCRMVTIRQDKRNAKDKRRIRIINSYVEPVNVIVLFKRDGGRCQICGKKLNLKRHVPHPLAVTRDHIVPLYQGGEHSYKNTQLACFMCNSIKGCRTISGGEQLLLFGDPA